MDRFPGARDHRCSVPGGTARLHPCNGRAVADLARNWSLSGGSRTVGAGCSGYHNSRRHPARRRSVLSESSRITCIGNKTGGWPGGSTPRFPGHPPGMATLLEEKIHSFEPEYTARRKSSGSRPFPLPAHKTTTLRLPDSRVFTSRACPAAMG